MLVCLLLVVLFQVNLGKGTEGPVLTCALCVNKHLLGTKKKLTTV